jgi:invasion protein IalB
MKLSQPFYAGIAAAAFLMAPLSVLAQDAPAEAPAAETPAAETPAAPAAGSAVDDVAAAVDNLASQNWLKVCEDTDDGQRACLMRQVVIAGDTFQGSFILRDDPGQESRLLAVAAVPLGVLLPFGLTWQIDNATPVRVPYMLCDPMSCSAQLVINEQYINSLKRGSQLVLTAKNRNNEDLNIRINLAGFTASYDSEEALTFEQVRQQESGQNALEQVLQDRAEQLRQQLSTDGAATPPAEGEATPEAAPAAEAPAQ